jgi:hypothetical protein
MRYDKELAFYLRQRGMSEGNVAEKVAEIRAHPAADDDAALIEEFGPASQLAEKYPDRATARTPGRVIISVAVLIAVAFAVTRLVLFPYFDIDLLDGTGPIRLWPAWAIIAVGLVGGFLVDRHRPVPASPSRSR